MPPGWKPSKKPILVLGVISDTHIRTMPTSGRIDREWSEKYLVKALTHFRDENVDAVVHCGDFAHLGQVEEMQAHADAWNRAFPNNRAPAGHEVVKLFVVGNHELRGSTYGGKGMFVRRLYPDPEERARHVLASDMAGNWERIWGEKYEPVWHKVVKGFHFFGMQWGVDDAAMADLVDRMTGCEPPRPFFVLRHDYPPSTLLARMKKHPNAVGLFGHLHYSISNWRKIFLADGMPWIQVPSLHAHGYPGLREEDPWLTKLKIEGMEAAGSVRARQGMVIRLYDDMMVVERREFGEGGSLGADWVMPFGKYDPHPFSLEEQKKKIGAPQFRAGAKLEVSLGRIDKINKIENTTNHHPVNPVSPVQEDSASLRLCVKIPLADGNPDSRVYAYEVVVVGEGQKLHKVVYAVGCNMGIGHEPNGGVTELAIPKSDLPSGNTLAFSVCPITSLGTRGAPLSAKWASPL
ncbi:MAG: metallophosphoesterase [Kiritimatiellae bacterium]|nr:metallophosphoesterase [Kiritimatiellia bacterium]